MSSEEPAPETSELIGAYRSQLPFLQQDALGNSVADLLCGEEGFRFSGRRASLSEFVQSVPLIGPGKTTEAEQTEDSLHYLKISNFSFGLTNREAVMRIRKDFVKPHKLDKYLAQPNDIMIANLGTGASIGKLALTRPCDSPAVYNTNLFVLRRVSSGDRDGASSCSSARCAESQEASCAVRPDRTTSTPTIFWGLSSVSPERGMLRPPG